MSLSKNVPYDIIYTKTYALAQIPHTCAGPPLRWAFLRKYFCFMHKKSQSCRYHTYYMGRIANTEYRHMSL
jgi:hypothetical protein